MKEQALTDSKKFIPDLHPQVWVLAAGRFLSLIGTGFTLYYAPIYFKQSVGLSAALVGMGLGLSQVPGMAGRILGGTFSDRPSVGRRRTLVLSAVFCALGALLLAAATAFPLFLIGCLVKGFGVGLYWPASEALVADLTTPRQRTEAYALNRMGDNLGLGLGVILGGILIKLTAAYRALFIIDAISFLIFMVLIYSMVRDPERKKESVSQISVLESLFDLIRSWLQALRDVRLAVFLPVNILFTFFMAQVSSTLPLQLSQLNGGSGLTSMQLTACFTWYVCLTAILQMPITRRVKHINHPAALAISAVLWAAGFIAIWVVTLAMGNLLIYTFVAFAILALATIFYTPSASALIADIAPDSIRGVYTSINSLCWAAGYLIGPWLGGKAMDLPPEGASRYWVCLAGITAVALIILAVLNRLLKQSPTS